MNSHGGIPLEKSLPNLASLPRILWAVLSFGAAFCVDSIIILAQNGKYVLAWEMAASLIAFAFLFHEALSEPENHTPIARKRGRERRKVC